MVCSNKAPETVSVIHEVNQIQYAYEEKPDIIPEEGSGELIETEERKTRRSCAAG